LNARGFHVAIIEEPPRCIGCRMCAISCPDSAIEVFAEGTVYLFFDY
jgi:formate hydrogenlyase subunit 6/NADH:ubiquinone oxidoreductase subunit I